MCDLTRHFCNWITSRPYTFTWWLTVEIGRSKMRRIWDEIRKGCCSQTLSGQFQRVRLVLEWFWHFVFLEPRPGARTAVDLCAKQFGWSETLFFFLWKITFRFLFAIWGSMSSQTVRRLRSHPPKCVSDCIRYYQRPALIPIEDDLIKSIDQVSSDWAT